MAGQGPGQRRADYERVPADDVPGREHEHQHGEDSEEDEDLKEVQGEDIDLPQDVYGAIIFTVIHDSVELMSGKDHDRLSCWVNVIRVIFVVTSLTFNYVLQLSLLVWSYRYVVAPDVRSAQNLYREYHAECFDVDGTFNEAKWQEWDSDKVERLCGMVISSFWFLYLFLCLWWMTMLNEFRKTDRLARKLHSMLHTSDYERMLETDQEGVQRAKRLVREVRWILYLILIIPKHIVSVGLLVMGTWWLTATDSFAEMILNALALEFVIEIDELIFEAMFPSMMEESISRFKLWRPTDPDPRVQQRVVWEFYRRSATYWAVILFGVYLYVSFLQDLPWIGVLPGFKSDIHCQRYWTAQATMICNSWAVWKGAECFPYGSADTDSLPPHPEVYS